MSVSYPLQWLIRTFPNKERVHELLEPEREKGNVTSHDYELAKSFFPGYHRYYPYIYGGISMLCADVLVKLRFPRWTLWRRFWVGTAAGIPFVMAGVSHRSWEHVQFSLALENPLGFARALENVNTGLGGVRPLHLTFVVKREGRLGLLNPEDGSVTFLDGPRGTPPSPPERTTLDANPDAEYAATENSPPGKYPVMDAIRQSSSWDAIRKANSQAKESTWDNLRQQHERANLPNAVRDDQSTTEYSQPVKDERATEQAKFDALLEAERNISRKSEGGVNRPI